MTSDPVKHILSQFGKRQMTTTPQNLAERLHECSNDTRRDIQPAVRALLAEAASALRSRDSVIEPTAYLQKHAVHGTSLGFHALTVADKAAGYTETPLYAALSSHEETAGGWRPIETAPKDGTEILVLFVELFNTPYVTKVRWDEDRSAKSPKPRWDSTDRLYTRGDALHILPTHWMPLPPPPQSPAMIKAAKGGEI